MRRLSWIFLAMPLVLAPALRAEGELDEDLHQAGPRPAAIEAAPAEPEPQNSARANTSIWPTNQHYGWNSQASDYWANAYRRYEQRYHAVDLALYRLAVTYPYGSWQARQMNQVRTNGRTTYNRYRYNPSASYAWSLETWLNFYESWLRSYGYLGNWNYPYANRTTYYTNPQIWYGDDTNRRYQDTQASATYPDYSAQRVTSNMYWGDYGNDASTFTRGPGVSTGGDLEFRLAPEATGDGLTGSD